MRLKTNILASLFAAALVVGILGSCSKINICKNPESIQRIWRISQWVVGDSIVDLTPPNDSVRLTVAFLPNGDMLFDYFGLVSESTYRIYRYENKCIIDPALFEFNWEIEKLTSDAMEVQTWTLLPDTAGVDQLTTVFINLEGL